jgi:hypothetical protein
LGLTHDQQTVTRQHDAAGLEPILRQRTFPVKLHRAEAGAELLPAVKSVKIAVVVDVVA